MGKQKYVVNVRIEANIILEAEDQERAKEQVEKSGNSITTSDIEVTSIEVTNIELIKGEQNVFRNKK